MPCVVIQTSFLYYIGLCVSVWCVCVYVCLCRKIWVQLKDHVNNYKVRDNSIKVDIKQEVDHPVFYIYKLKNYHDFWPFMFKLDHDGSPWQHLSWMLLAHQVQVTGYLRSINSSSLTKRVTGEASEINRNCHSGTTTICLPLLLLLPLLWF